MQKKMNFKLLGLAVVTLLASACAQLERRSPGPEVRTTPQVTGPQDRDDFHTPSIPVVADKEEKRVAVILGPGGYKSFAHLGVLKELKKSDIPIHKVVGIEWGGLVGALFAQRGQVHELEWKLYKLERVELGGSGFFSRQSGPYELQDLDGFLTANVDKININATTVPFEVPILSLRTGAVTWPNAGPLRTAISQALPAPPLFRANGDNMAALLSTDEAVRRLTNEGYNVIILIDVLGDGPLFDKSERKKDDATAALWTESRRELWALRSHVTDTIRVPTTGIRIDDFESRKVLVTAGEAAGARAAKELLSKYGF